MKVEQLEKLSELINDKGMLDALVDETEENISYILEEIANAKQSNSIADLLKNRSFSEIRELILKLKNINRETTRSNFLVDKSILNSRNYDEHMRLIDVYINNYDKSEGADNSQLNYIIFLYEVLENRTADNQIDIIRKYYNKFDLPYVHFLLIDNIILEKRTYKDQLALVDKVIEINTLEIMDNSLIALFNSPFMLEYRSVDEQLKLIDCYLKYGSLTDCDSNLLELIVNPRMLEKRTCDEQIKLIEKYIETNRNMQVWAISLAVDTMSFDEQYSELNRFIETDIQERIESINDLKKLVKQLKENDVKSFDRNTKIIVKEPIKKSAYLAMQKRKGN